MLPSKEKILKRNDGFKELVLSCFGSLINKEHARVYALNEQAAQAAAQKAEDEAADPPTAPPVEGYYTVPDYETRLFNWLLKQLKSSDIINQNSQLQAKAHYVEAVLAMFDDAAEDDIKYLPQGEQIDLNEYVDWDLSKPIIMNKILESEYLFGLSID
jgi:hypothetical protein